MQLHDRRSMTHFQEKLPFTRKESDGRNEFLSCAMLSRDLSYYIVHDVIPC